MIQIILHEHYHQFYKIHGIKPILRSHFENILSNINESQFIAALGLGIIS